MDENKDELEIVEEVKIQRKDQDRGGFAWGCLGFCIPIVGLILWLVWRDEKPKTAKAVGIGALVSAIIGAVFVVIYFIFLVFIIGMTIATTS
ncbi:hypothetical protein [Fusobacterium ulcerans]|jgi:hypothetical protein|uniref:DUF4190 domain-containing protein n=1 Tax=Fusobacterium ulcerans TaxID=861 RepID=A0AAX2JD11_9FUSO|nr:hypothetical protein [Fusobacterium ulcerans]AVQ27110.1 hypothetical protein C4N20_03050 [Fusobacterium ulcerans]EFS24763.1 hypothetical protein FUAG_00278 [Fusobacterium ulcerans ATCC 49185]MCB8564270.1 hypothetical protein [Fusobacterium ulcerans]MCB8648142.1 hypothetical protein [Fusobacterium ulcerans]SQJ10863.1 Uncharacterised protein [Fusobacterium ulcerans]